MTAIRSGTAACSRSFRLLAAALEGGDAAHRSLLDPANLEDEYGRFRVWAGNLGAQQKGHSSLDYRLRDSPLLQSNVLKLLRELELNLDEARSIVTGARLPYEQQAVRGDFSDDSASEDSEDGETSGEEEHPRYELQQRMFEIVDVVSNLYRLSIRIRSPTVKTRALQAAAYRQVDSATGVDVFSQYAEYDKKYTEEALAQLSAGRKGNDVAFLVERISRAITRRRQQFKYWKKHRDKLSSPPESEDTTSHLLNGQQPLQRETAPNVTDDPIRTSEPVEVNLSAPPSENQPRTLLSGTEATAHHRTLDDAVDSQSVTSVATTARDLDGHGIDIPPPPSSADGERDFECPYCFVICPAQYYRVRSWKTHILQDLQPYVCTYKDCPLPDQMFRSRREWLEHESSTHRRVWRCPGHPDAVYSSQGGLRHHLETSHEGSLPEMQIRQLISLAETSTNDLRETCPICFVSVNDPGVGNNLHNHIANHLERLASFALPKFTDPDEDKSGASMDASDGRGSYSEKSNATGSLLSIETPSVDENEQLEPAAGLNLAAEGRMDASENGEEPIRNIKNADLPGLSADAVKSLPDGSYDKLAQFVENARKSTKEGRDIVSGITNANSESAKGFEIHAVDEPADLSREVLGSVRAEGSEDSCTVRVYNLPKSIKERKEFADSFSALGPRLHLGPNFESRGYAIFRSQKEAEHAVSTFDKSKFPDVVFGYDKDGKEHTDGTVSSQNNAEIEFDVGGFLEALSRALSEPENEKLIAWAEDGRAFCIFDEEGFARNVLPAFGLESFSLFNDRLIACGFRREFGQVKTDPERLKRTSIWTHKNLQRDNQGLRGQIPFFTKLQRLFSKTSSQLSSQPRDVGREGRTASFKKSDRPSDLKAASDIPSISDLYFSGGLQPPIAAVADSYSEVPKEKINRKISMLQHDITMLDVDAIVNGAVPDLSVGTSDSLSYWIHKAAGPGLLKECQSLPRCHMGQAVMTDAYNLPCRKIIHTVRPHYFHAYNSASHDNPLATCYRNCLRLAVEKGLKSIAFPCLSAGGFGFPSREAAVIALRTTRGFLESGVAENLQKVVFCVYTDVDQHVYKALIPLFFPPGRTQLGEREALKEIPGSIDQESSDNTTEQEQEDIFDMEFGTAGPSKPRRSMESLGWLPGGASLWTCCKCRARPMETQNCLVCYHEFCPSCEGENPSDNTPNLFLVHLQPSPNMLEDSQRSGLSSLERRDMISLEDKIKTSVRSRQNSPIRNHHPTYIKAHRKHLSLDTLFYYDLPFQFDSHDQDYIIVTRELSEEQTKILFEHSRRHRRNLPSLIRTRTHPNSRSHVLTIRIGSEASFNKQDRPPGAPIFLPEPFVTADHCDFYIEASQQWVLEINRGSGSTFLNGRRLVRLPAPDDNEGEEHGQQTTPALPPHDNRGYFIRSGDILGLGENDDGKPVYLFRVEVDNVNGTEGDLWEEAEARASRYGFPIIGLDDDDHVSGHHAGSAAATAGEISDTDTDVDPDIVSGYRIIDAPTAEDTNVAHIPEQARGARRWTRIDRRLVNPDSLKEAGLFFENRVRFMVVFRELSAAEVRRLAQRTRESREAKAETEFTRKERRRKERRIREQKKVARERKKELVEAEGSGELTV